MNLNYALARGRSARRNPLSGCRLSLNIDLRNARHPHVRGERDTRPEGSCRAAETRMHKSRETGTGSSRTGDCQAHFVPTGVGPQGAHTSSTFGRLNELTFQDFSRGFEPRVRRRSHQTPWPVRLAFVQRSQQGQIATLPAGPGAADRSRFMAWSRAAVRWRGAPGRRAPVAGPRG